MSRAYVGGDPSQEGVPVRRHSPCVARDGLTAAGERAVAHAVTSTMPNNPADAWNRLTAPAAPEGRRLRPRRRLPRRLDASLSAESIDGRGHGLGSPDPTEAACVLRPRPG